MNNIEKIIKVAFVFAALAMIFHAGTAFSAETGAAKNSRNEKNEKKAVQGGETDGDEITADGEEAGTEKAPADKAGAAEEKKPSGAEKGGYSFNYKAESKIDKMSRERLKTKTFLEKISNEFFEIYVDEDDYTVIANFPFGKENSAYTLKFKDEFQLVVTFTHKTDKSKKPVRYEITFPDPTKKEVFDFTVRDRLELNVPIDFFYVERKNMR